MGGLGHRRPPRICNALGAIGSSPRSRLGTLFAGAALAVAISACGRAPISSAPSAAQSRAALSGSPPPLAALHQRANRLLPGGPQAVRAELAALRGYPVLVNKWGSWCGPCRFEFPFFQRVAVRFGRRIGFVGVDGGDNPGDARNFLGRFPVTYPSFEDPQEQIARSLHMALGYPETLFLDRAGHTAFIHIGVYPSEAKLAEDVQRYLRP